MKKPEYYNEKASKSVCDFREKLLSECDKCDHQGYFPNEAEWTYEECECMKRFNRCRKYIEAGIDPRNALVDKSYIIGTFDKETINRINVYIGEKLHVNMLFMPRRKTDWGSDIVAKYILRQFCSSSECMVVTLRSLISMFFDFDDERYYGCSDYLRSVDYLLIESMGQEYNRKMKDDDSFVITSLNAFISERYSKGLTTFISTNFTKDILHKTYSGEFVRILADNFRVFPVSCSCEKTDVFDDIELSGQKRIGECFETLELLRNRK
jgi:hypothetical protein